LRKKKWRCNLKRWDFKKFKVLNFLKELLKWSILEDSKTSIFLENFLARVLLDLSMSAFFKPTKM
jgi:hypothetical protein